MTDTRTFIRESNAIEGVHDDAAVDETLDALEYLIEAGELTHETVKGTHERIMSQRQPEIGGEYRDVYVRVGGDIPTPPEKVYEEMDALLNRAPSTPFEAVEWHVAFEQVHPFADGNGRAGRLIYYWHCTEQLGCEPVLWRAEDRYGYYALFDSPVTVDGFTPSRRKQR